MKRLPRLPDPLETDMSARDLLALQRVLAEYAAPQVRVTDLSKFPGQPEPRRDSDEVEY